jgi:transcriptional regulator with GAF, ATPase, and Fis domain
MAAKLIAIAGPLKDYQWELAADSLSIGRDLSNDICIPAGSVSRQHCRILRTDDGFTIEDLGSRNGTLINGSASAKHSLSHADKIAVGDSIFVFAAEGQDYELSAPGIVEEPMGELTETSELRAEDAFYLNPGKLTERGRSAELARDLHAILNIATKAAAATDSHHVQREILHWLFEVTPAKCAAVLLCEAGPWPPTWQLSVNRDGDPEADIRVSSTVVRRAFERRAAFLINDANERPDLKHAQSIVDLRARSIACVPLIARDKAIGVLYLDTRNSLARLERDHLELLMAIAKIAGLAIENAQRVDALRRQAELLRSDLSRRHSFVGDTPAMRSVYATIAKVARADSTVLILGESGTGKELAAREIHKSSPRAEKPFIAINCATLGENLLESELFGHEKGAFTGAHALKKGQLEVAEGGTVFLDELAEAPLAVQAKLLRVLQEREFVRMGGTKSTHINVRLIAATNKDLRNAVKEGSFREDLWYRLNVVCIKMPPLRERREDIPVLANHFAQKFSRDCARGVMGISPAAESLLVQYDWPGNVRELENAIERAVVLGGDEVILPEDLPEALLETGLLPSDEDSIHASVRDTKKKRILAAMEEARGNYTHAAKILGVHPTYLHRLIRNLDLKSELVQRFATGKTA